MLIVIESSKSIVNFIFLTSICFKSFLSNSIIDINKKLLIEMRVAFLFMSHGFDKKVSHHWFGLFTVVHGIVKYDTVS
jgi:hypothetical protein